MAECGVGSRVLINYSDKAVVLYGGVVIDVRKAPPAPPDVTPQRRRVRGPPVLAAHLQDSEFLIRYDGWSSKYDEWRAAKDVAQVFPHVGDVFEDASVLGVAGGSSSGGGGGGSSTPAGGAGAAGLASPNTGTGDASSAAPGSAAPPLPPMRFPRYVKMKELDPPTPEPEPEPEVVEEAPASPEPSTREEEGGKSTGRKRKPRSAKKRRHEDVEAEAEAEAEAAPAPPSPEVDVNAEYVDGVGECAVYLPGNSNRDGGDGPSAASGDPAASSLEAGVARARACVLSPRSRRQVVIAIRGCWATDSPANRKMLMHEIIEVVLEGRGRSGGGEVSMDTVFSIIRDLSRGLAEKLSFAALMLTIEEGRVDLFPMILMTMEEFRKVRPELYATTKCMMIRLCVLKEWELCMGEDPISTRQRVLKVMEFLPAGIPRAVPEQMKSNSLGLARSISAASQPTADGGVDAAGEGAVGAGASASASAAGGADGSGSAHGAVGAKAPAASPAKGSVHRDPDVTWRKSEGVEAGVLRVLRSELLTVAREPARIADYVTRYKLSVALYHVKQWLNAVKRQWDAFMPPDDADVVGQLI